VSRLLVVVAAVLSVLALGGCREAGRAASPVEPSVSVSADPLAGIEATLDAVERELDTDADADAAR
jgi:hypothetical protein